MDVLTEDPTPSVTQTLTANGVKKEAEVQKSESLEDKAARLQREAKEKLQELQSNEQHSKHVLVTLLQQLQSRWTSSTIPMTVF